MRKDEKRVATQIRLPLRLKNAIGKRAVAERRSTNDQMIILLELALSKAEAAPPAPPPEAQQP